MHRYDRFGFRRERRAEPIGIHIQRVALTIDQNRFCPEIEHDSAVAAKVMVGTITSSRSRMPTAFKARCSAAVAEFTATVWRDPTNRQNRFSNSLTLAPVVNQPDFKTSTTAASRRNIWS
jgi:hypothetical protein